MSSEIAPERDRLLRYHRWLLFHGAYTAAVVVHCCLGDRERGVYVSAVFSTRLWMYTQDARLMQESPEFWPCYVSSKSRPGPS